MPPIFLSRFPNMTPSKPHIFFLFFLFNNSIGAAHMFVGVRPSAGVCETYQGLLPPGGMIFLPPAPINCQQLLRKGWGLSTSAICAKVAWSCVDNHSSRELMSAIGTSHPENSIPSRSSASPPALAFFPPPLLGWCSLGLDSGWQGLMNMSYLGLSTWFPPSELWPGMCLSVDYYPHWKNNNNSNPSPTKASLTKADSGSGMWVSTSIFRCQLDSMGYLAKCQ